MTPYYSDAQVTLYQGDCLALLPQLGTASIDAMVTDPPAGIGFMGNEWDDFRRSRNPADVGRKEVWGRMSRSGPEYGRGERASFIDFLTVVMAECLRVLKPGAHSFVWAIPRTSHWTATAIEDAGFEIRDVITHHFGNGFPKSLDVSKAIDKAAGATRERIRGVRSGVVRDTYAQDAWSQEFKDSVLSGKPITAEADRWQGWGTALKPASEHWILARKPLSEPTVAANVLTHGTGALNVDASRIAGDVPQVTQGAEDHLYGGGKGLRSEPTESHPSLLGRWPANLILSHSSDCQPIQGRRVDVEAWDCSPDCPVAELDRQSGDLTSGHLAAGTQREGIGYRGGLGVAVRNDFPSNSGGASRFFYTAKAGRSERNAGLEAMDERPILWSSGEANPGSFQAEGTHRAARNFHPTVKPLDLMRYLARLITPPGGGLLDPFAGSGTTLMAARLEGFQAIGIEREPDYCAIAARRIKWATYEPPLLETPA